MLFLLCKFISRTQFSPTIVPIISHMYQLTQKHPSKRAFITGAASGLGKAFSLELAKDGWTIGMADINVPDLEAAATEIESAGGRALIFPLDVADKDQYKL
ncbi:MAG: SDR family NAD(P)-dependent oxidoreductase, partial [Sediminibacterium sp.]